MSLGKHSLELLATCDLELQRLVHAVADDIDARPGLLVHDITVVCGHRGKEAQHAAFTAVPPTSKLDWPDSKHNAYPSLAVDLAPYPTDWSHKGDPAFLELRVRVAAVAQDLNIKIRHISWDLPHTELRL
jgi:peptidoglycan L-alanyl-D-glutamate endopeptidase CwlK